MNSSNGYDTLVGERGMQLSGGERQRISIARAFIKQAPVLILDEPTSSLDVKTEAQIMESIELLMKGRTTFMITHRLDTLKTCNVLLHVEEGKLAEVVRDYDTNFMEKKKIGYFKKGIRIMIIVLVSQEYPPETARGGIGSQTYVKAHGLAGFGHEVYVISRSTDDKRHEKKRWRICYPYSRNGR